MKKVILKYNYNNSNNNNSNKYMYIYIKIININIIIIKIIKIIKNNFNIPKNLIIFKRASQNQC